jgi:hypothetical protein
MVIVLIILFDDYKVGQVTLNIHWKTTIFNSGFWLSIYSGQRWTWTLAFPAVLADFSLRFYPVSLGKECAV